MVCGYFLWVLVESGFCMFWAEARYPQAFHYPDLKVGVMKTASIMDFSPNFIEIPE
jgi:hypothetical protein